MLQCYMLTAITAYLHALFSDQVDETVSPVEAQTEEQLLSGKKTTAPQQNKAKVEQAYVDLYKKYRERLYNYVYLLVKDYDAAQDITANTFVKMYRRWGELQSHPNHLGWLYLVAKNEVIDHYRHATNKPMITFAELDLLNNNHSGDEQSTPIDETLFDAAQYRSLLDEVVQDEDNKKIKELLQTLSLDDQTILYLRYYEELPFAELAVIYNKSEDAMKMYVHRLLKKMAEKNTEINQVTLAPQHNGQKE